jgi:hypothetical protein
MSKKEITEREVKNLMAYFAKRNHDKGGIR